MLENIVNINLFKWSVLGKILKFFYRVTTRENYNYPVTYRKSRIEKNNHLPLNGPSDYFKLNTKSC